MIVILGRRLLSFPTVSELRRLKTFFSSHLSSILASASSICLQFVAPCVISSLSALTSAVWMAEANLTEKDVSHIICATARELTLRGRQSLAKISSFSHMTTGADGDQNVVNKILLVGGAITRALCSGRIALQPLEKGQQSQPTASSPNMSSCSSSCSHAIGLLDVDRFIGWRSSCALFYCSDLSQSLTVGGIIEARKSISVLQELYNGWNDIDNTVMDVESSGCEIDVNIGIVAGRWTFVLGWISSLFGTLAVAKSETNCKCSRMNVIMNWLKGMIERLLHEPLAFRGVQQQLLEMEVALDEEIEIIATIVVCADNTVKNCIREFALPILHLLKRFINWLISVNKDQEKSILINHDELEKLWSILMSLGGCWRLHSGVNVVGGKAALDTLLYLKKEEIEQRLAEAEREVRLEL